MCTHARLAAQVEQHGVDPPYSPSCTTIWCKGQGRGGAACLVAPVHAAERLAQASCASLLKGHPNGRTHGVDASTQQSPVHVHLSTKSRSGLSSSLEPTTRETTESAGELLQPLHTRSLLAKKSLMLMLTLADRAGAYYRTPLPLGTFSPPRKPSAYLQRLILREKNAGAETPQAREEPAQAKPSVATPVPIRQTTYCKLCKVQGRQQKVVE